MTQALSGISVIERLLTRLLYDGYRVEMVAASPVGEVRGSVCSMALRFSEPAPETEVATIHAEIELRGSAYSGQLRQWRITRLLEKQGECPRLGIEAVLHLAGDISIDMVRAQMREGHHMLQELLRELKVALDDIPLAEGDAVPASGPEVFVRMRAAGELIVGRSGLARQRDRVEYISWQQRKTRLAICERLAGDIFPTVERAGAEVMAEYLTRLPGDFAAPPTLSTRPCDELGRPVLPPVASAQAPVVGPESPAHHRNPPSTLIS